MRTLSIRLLPLLPLLLLPPLAGPAHAAPPPPKPAPRSGGLTLATDDGRLALRLFGDAQIDARLFPEDDAEAGLEVLEVRRARPGLEATLWQRLTLRLLLDFGRGQARLLDAYLDAKLWPELRLRVGRFKTPTYLEFVQSPTQLLFAERGLLANLGPQRDVGAQVHGDIDKGLVVYAAGVLSGAADGADGDERLDDGIDAHLRVFAQPLRKLAIPALRGLGLGAAASYGVARGDEETPRLGANRTAGRARFFQYAAGDAPGTTTRAAGPRVRLLGQAFWYFGPVGLQAELLRSSHEIARGQLRATAAHLAWQVVGTFVLTLDDAAFTGVVPKHPFDPAAGHWGAVELSARLASLDIDDVVFDRGLVDPDRSASAATAWTATLTWHLDAGWKLLADVERTTFTGGAPGGDRPAETTVVIRAQAAL